MAHEQVRRQSEKALLVLAPRHPRRADAVAALCEERGWTVARRSKSETPAQVDVWLIDTLGELANFMALAEVVFMGGSLVPIGGHNLLEPVAIGAPIVTGPHNENAADIFDALQAGDGLQQINSARELGKAISDALRQPELTQQQVRNDAEVLSGGQGALAKACRALDEILQTVEHSA